MTPERARDLLGVPADADRHQIERAFRRLARIHHPDRGGDAGRFTAVVAARDRLLGKADASGDQVIVVRTRPWRRVVRVVQRWQFRRHRPRPGTRVR